VSCEYFLRGFLGRVQQTPMFPCLPVWCPLSRLTILVHKGSRLHEKWLSTVLLSAIHRFHEARSLAPQRAFLVALNGSGDSVWGRWSESGQEAVSDGLVLRP
jgi:hypothetical protein